MESLQKRMICGLVLLLLLLLLTCSAEAWTGEIHGRVVCDVCGDSSIGPEDHALQGESIFFSKHNFSDVNFPMCIFFYIFYLILCSIC